MADNLTTTTTVSTIPNGTVIRTDDLGAAGHVQYIKVMDGTDGGTSPLKVAAEDAAHSTGDTGVMALAVRNDTPAALAGTTLDYIPLTTNAYGMVYVEARARLVSKKANFTRPADTTAYTAGDVVADSTAAPTVINFADVVEANGMAGHIVGAVLHLSVAAATAGQFELWLFNAAPGLDNDNAAFTPTDAEMRTRVAVIPFTLYHDGTASGNRTYIGTLLEGPIPFVCAAADVDFYGELVVRNAYAPSASEEFYFELLIERAAA